MPGGSLNPGAKGLAATDEFIREHDDTMVKDYDEDLNALLILVCTIATMFGLTLTLSHRLDSLQQF